MDQLISQRLKFLTKNPANFVNVSTKLLHSTFVEKRNLSLSLSFSLSLSLSRSLSRSFSLYLSIYLSIPTKNIDYRKKKRKQQTNNQRFPESNSYISKVFLRKITAKTILLLCNMTISASIFFKQVSNQETSDRQNFQTDFCAHVNITHSSKQIRKVMKKKSKCGHSLTVGNKIW